MTGQEFVEKKHGKNLNPRLAKALAGIYEMMEPELEQPTNEKRCVHCKKKFIGTTWDGLCQNCKKQKFYNPLGEI